MQGTHLEGVNDAGLDHVLIHASGSIEPKCGCSALGLRLLQQLPNNDCSLHTCSDQATVGLPTSYRWCCCEAFLTFKPNTFKPNSKALHCKQGLEDQAQA